jgi:heme exporter protein B
LDGRAVTRLRPEGLSSDGSAAAGGRQESQSSDGSAAAGGRQESQSPDGSAVAGGRPDGQALGGNTLTAARKDNPSRGGAATTGGRPRAATPLLTAVGLTLARDLRLAFRKRGQLVQPLVFFAIVTTLFPLAISPELSRLRDVAPGVLWVAALLSSQLALEFLFRDDAHDGTLEQYALSGQSLTWLLFSKTAAHWLLTGLPLAVMAPLAGLSLGVPAAAVPGIVASVAVGSVALSLIGSMGAALTLGVKRSVALLSLLTLPLAMPVLIFGARATELAIKGESFGAPLQLLSAVAVLGVTLAPLATAAAVRVNLE